MKYKTAFRLAMKALGVYLIIDAATSVFSSVGWFIHLFAQVQQWTPVYGYLGNAVGHVFQFAVGIYFVRGAKRIVDWIIPGNRPYCPECAYDLTGAVSERCPECGTPFAWDAVRPGKADPP